MRLDGKVAVVTGGTLGIGRATVEKFHAEGARVVSLATNRERTDALAAEYHDRDRPVLALVADVTDEAAVTAAMEQVRHQFGRIDVLVNNAGVNAYFDATTMTEADWDSVFAVDLKGAWLCAKHALPTMREQRAGSIVNISSIHSLMTISGMFPYAAAKSGLVGMTRSMALDFGPDNIRVNAICPGWTRTNLVQEWFDMQPDPAAAEQEVIDVHPLGRIATPAEVANFIAFVASDEASFITGAALLIDGGLSAQFAH